MAYLNQAKDRKSCLASGMIREKTTYDNASPDRNYDVNKKSKLQ